MGVAFHDLTVSGDRDSGVMHAAAGSCRAFRNRRACGEDSGHSMVRR